MRGYLAAPFSSGTTTIPILTFQSSKSLARPSRNDLISTCCFFPTDESSPIYRYFDGQCSDELHSLTLPVLYTLPCWKWVLILFISSRLAGDCWSFWFSPPLFVVVTKCSSGSETKSINKQLLT